MAEVRKKPLDFLAKKIKDADISLRLVRYMSEAFSTKNEASGVSEVQANLKNNHPTLRDVWEKKNLYNFLFENCDKFNSQCWEELSDYFKTNGYQLKKIKP